MATNPAGKRVKREDAYEVWQTPDKSWTWYCLKKYQTDDSKQYARWFCEAVTPYTPDGEFGDVYVSSVKSQAVRIGGTLPVEA